MALSRIPSLFCNKFNNFNIARIIIIHVRGCVGLNMIVKSVQQIFSCTNIYCNFEKFRENFISRIALKDILSMLKIRDFGLINLHQKRTKRFRHFARVLFLQSFASEVSRK